MKVPAVLLFCLALGAPTAAQWLNHPTPGIPRTPAGKPDLTAPSPRAANGKPDLSGIWVGVDLVFPIPDEALTAQSKALLRERQENYGKDRPSYQCRPRGPEPIAGWRRIVQQSNLTMILHDTLTYRVIFTDGRVLESDPERTWMGYSVGRWEGDTFIVDSFGFNDRTWLDWRGGLPHTDALRTTERYERRNVGQIHVTLNVTDPGAFSGSWTTEYDLQLRPDTEILEAVCEDKSRFIGRLSEVEQTSVVVPPSILAKYVGVYSGMWGPTMRTVRIRLEGSTLHTNGVVLGEDVRLVPTSDNFFMGTNGLTYEFDAAANQPRS